MSIPDRKLDFGYHTLLFVKVNGKWNWPQKHTHTETGENIS